MRTTWCVALLLSLTAGTGCVTLFDGPTTKPAPPPLVSTLPKAPPPVTADQVTETNAHDMATAMTEELDRDWMGEK